MKKQHFMYITGFLVGLLLSSCGASPPSREAPEEAIPAPPVSAAPAAQAVALGDHALEKKTSAKQAKPQTWKRSRIQANTSRLKIGDDETLPLKAVQANVRIEGFRARVILDTYYFNPHPGQLEGTFQLRLPEGATPYFFAFGKMEVTAAVQFSDPIFMSQGKAIAMGSSPEAIMAARQDTWTAPKQARMVAKQKAALAYHDTVRRRIDPALMEWSGPGIFASRVYPLQPNKLHRIVVGYEVDLTAAGSDWLYELGLPEVQQNVVDIVIAEPADTAVTLEPDVTLTRKTVGERTVLVHRFTNTAHRRISLRLEPKGPVLMQWPAKKGEFFTARFQPPVREARARNPSERAVVAVDISLSANPDQFNVYLKLMQAVLQNNQEHIKQFAVVFFNIESFWWKSQWTANTPDNVRSLMAFANQLTLEGATDIHTALQQANAPQWNDQQTPWNIFLLSDGASTWGMADPYALSKPLTAAGHRLFAYRFGFAGTDLRTLNHLTRETGGALFSVTGASEVDNASTAYRQKPWRIRSIQLATGEDVLIAGRPTWLYPGQRLQIAGRGYFDDTHVSLVIKLQQGATRKEIQVDFTRIMDSELAPRAYGLISVGQLEMLGQASERIAQAYANHFRVPGQSSSLLMLESEADYERYNIHPDEDWFVIKNTPVTAYMDKLIQKIKDRLGDPKAAFLAWLKGLNQQPGFEFKAPTSLVLAAESMPVESFQVNTKRLQSKHHQYDLSSELKEQFANKTLHYDTVTNAAETRLKNLGKVDALKLISSLLETNPGDTVLIRDIGYTATAWHYPGHAYYLFQKAVQTRPYEPQTYRAIAGALADAGKTDLALLYYEIGLNGQWSGRFGQFKQIIGLDYLRFLKAVAAGQHSTSVPEYVNSRMESLTRYDPGAMDLVVSITWNTDQTDIDLHVVEPGGEVCYYKNRKTASGGRLTKDVTQGYGPEMYTLKEAEYGSYTVKTNYYASNPNRMGVRTKVAVTAIMNWGKKNEKIIQKTVSLKNRKAMEKIMDIEIE